MSILDRVFDALKSQVEMRSDLDQTTVRLDDLGKRLDRQDNAVFDHEKRLIRIEALIDLTRGGFSQRSLPSE